MKIVTFVFLVLLNEVLSTGNKDKEHVHFKIHVPEIIKHHIHTKTVFIHVHKTIPKKKSPPKKQHEEHHEDWSSWSSYDHHEEDKYGDEKTKDHKDHDYKWPDYKNHYDYGPKAPEHMDYSHHSYGKDEHKNHKDSYLNFPAHDYLKNNHQVGQTVGYSYPPQLAMHQPVKEMSHNEVEPYANSYEEGYRKGYHSETAGEFADELSKFHDANHDEGDEHDAGYEGESYGKTNAGRYFVNEDEAEYDQDADKYESDKRRIFSRIFGKKMR